ncbi:hypothetical protein Pmar_PMAR022607 [Perkinsus marinus ATCC 50983]|uniref:Uncharacterized protein n=1 Tax=Perkinsus marinus (strain ATCC 50983 / TXsc) TaxID=423536 RepID=C5KFK8_PERM5|nr:hypothetical protein Pmar_PMAR022607 [Perkinsus marinus ATCC 50983]EER16757.1 hypothetical protein Pmar_PMAR022607 [Perkinsus marinus ATCC 50983]|eukprot:XP_002784961.1 hypothetical protein Pmar_PMAR022607 [Perkinsus marinus ATCC 50983]
MVDDAQVICLLNVLGVSDVNIPAGPRQYCSSYFDELLSTLPVGMKDAYAKAREDFTFEAVDYDSDVTHEAEELKEDLRSTVLGKVPDSLLIALSSVPCDTAPVCQEIATIPKAAFQCLSVHDFVVRLSGREQWEDYVQLHKITGFVTLAGPFDFEGVIYTLIAAPYRAGAVLLDWPKVYQRV